MNFGPVTDRWMDGQTESDAYEPIVHKQRLEFWGVDGFCHGLVELHGTRNFLLGLFNEVKMNFWLHLFIWLQAFYFRKIYDYSIGQVIFFRSLSGDMADTIVF